MKPASLTRIYYRMLLATFVLASTVVSADKDVDVRRSIINEMAASFLIPGDWTTEASIHVDTDLWDVSFNAYKPSTISTPYKTAFFARMIDGSWEKTGLIAEHYIESSLLQMKLKKFVVFDIQRNFRNGMREISYSYVVRNARRPIKARVVTISDELNDRVYLLFFQSLLSNWEEDYIMGEKILQSAILGDRVRGIAHRRLLPWRKTFLHAATQANRADNSAANI